MYKHIRSISLAVTLMMAIAIFATTASAIETVEVQINRLPADWDEKTAEEKQEFLAGKDCLKVIDGDWGIKSEKALNDYLRGKCPKPVEKDETAEEIEKLEIRLKELKAKKANPDQKKPEKKLRIDVKPGPFSKEAKATGERDLTEEELAVLPEEWLEMSDKEKQQYLIKYFYLPPSADDGDFGKKSWEALDNYLKENLPTKEKKSD